MFKLKTYLRDVQCWQRYENFMELTVFLIRTVTVEGAPWKKKGAQIFEWRLQNASLGLAIKNNTRKIYIKTPKFKRRFRGIKIVFPLYNDNNLVWVPVPRFAPGKHCSQCGLLYGSPFSKRSYFGRQVSRAYTTRGSPLAARGGTMGEKRWPNGAWDMHPGFFYMPQICVMGPIILLPFRRKACWGFLSSCKNPTVWTRELGYQRPARYLCTTEAAEICI